MDIPKEREAFESWWEAFHNGRQIACDYVEEDNSYSVGYANAQWVAWQAKAQAVPDLGELQERIAGHQYYHDERGHMIVDMDDVVKEISGFDSWKAQAVPEGFVLVPKEPTLLMQRAGSAEAIKPNLGIVSMRDIYKAMIEAQEPAND